MEVVATEMSHIIAVVGKGGVGKTEVECWMRLQTGMRLEATPIPVGRVIEKMEELYAIHYYIS